MTLIRENTDVACYFVVKHGMPLKGKYKRIFSIGTAGITTYNPNNLEITNQWPYSELESIVPNVKTRAANEFIISFKKSGKKSDTMKFSTEHRADLITEALRFTHEFAQQISKPKLKFNAYKHHWSDTRIPIQLEIGRGALDQVDPSTNKTLCSYDYKDIENFMLISDYPGGFGLTYGGYGRLHFFASQNRDDIIQKCIENAMTGAGVTLRPPKESWTFEQCQNKKFGNFSSDECLTSLAEFTVHKVSPRHNNEQVRRLLCLSETCLIERDPGTYHIVTLRPLCDIFAAIRNQENPQLFSLEYVKGQVRHYTSTDRDSLLASLLDGVRASGNRDIHIKMCLTPRGMRLGPFTVPVDEEVESRHLKFLAQQPAGQTFGMAVTRFNCNVPYSGLLHAVTQDGLFAENKEKLINGALTALLAHEGDQEVETAEETESQFHALRRLVASKAGFQAFTELPTFREKVGVKVVRSLQRNDPGIAHAAIDVIIALMQPMHDDYDLRQEQLNKYSILTSKKFLRSLLDIFISYVKREQGSLVISALLDFLTFALCAPYSETTDGAQFDTLLEMAAEEGRCIFKLFQHPSLAIVKGAGMVMKAIIEEGNGEIAAKMQDLALAEGALPRHLHTAMFTLSTDSRMLTNRQLSRHLVGLWVTGHPTSMGLLQRTMPAGLLAYLDSPDPVPVHETDLMHVRDNLKLAQDHLKGKQSLIQWREVEKQVELVLQHWRARLGLQNVKDQDKQRPIVLRKRRQRIKSEANWPLFYYQFYKDHARPNLIWNHKTREELKDALENEIRGFNTDRDLSANCMISWNHSEFEVQYRSLIDEIKIGEYYLRLLLEEDDEECDEISTIKRSYEFFNDLYHRFLLSPKIAMKCQCLQAMTIVYGRCFEEIGSFNDTKYIVGMLERCTDRLERDRLIFFLHKLTLNRKNVKEIMDANGIRILVDLLTLAHLHTSRATVPAQSNVIEAAPDMWKESEKEWYYGKAERERQGPFSFSEMKELYESKTIDAKTMCWAPGLDGWRPLNTIPQLKWCLVASGTGVLNESDLATLILNMLIRIVEYYPSRDLDGAIVRPLPRAKRLLSEAHCLPHIVQLLLTFDPILVEKVATLLYHIMQDNPNISRLYLTGVHFFVMMYTGSNVLPLARFLQYTHVKQAFRSDENKASDLMLRSILGNILPDAMVCYLENYGAEKFAEIFLGEFDTPEAIWSNEMRRLMIEKIAAHLADFTPRLQSNTRALYQYCPIPAITYPQLENELFCNIYYLRHLCDVQRFPEWPIKDPVKLLKDILDAWKAEVEKKPPTMSIEDAYKVLKLKPAPGGHEENVIRKAYFKLAQKYHPDKNPEGRDVFEQVNKAYEFLCSKSARSIAGPDPQNIVLVLRAQSILFSRYREELHPYKYAGYPMLIKTILMETGDEQLFSKSHPLLAASCELAYHTVNCSALNAEELRREQGIEHLQDALVRCTSVLSASTKPEEMTVQVCSHILHCYSVAAQFEACREKIVERQPIIKELYRILYYKHLTRLCLVATECVSAFSIDYYLQNHMFQAGILYHLLLFLFNYDFTLDEGGVTKSDDSNQQEVANNLAKQSIRALSRIAGYSITSATPVNKTIQAAVTAMMTPYLARQLCDSDNFTRVLKVLNSNTENPYLIWDNATRAELNEYLTTQMTNKMRTGECDPSLGAEFEFSIHAKELVIGEIFVRVYNEQPTFVIEQPKAFAIDLLDFLGSQAQYLHSLLQLTASGNLADSNKSERLHQVEMALEALRNIVRSNPGVEIQCIGHFRLLFSLLRLHGCEKVQQLALEVVASVTKNQECVQDIAASEILVYLLLLINSLPACQLTVIETLYALTSNTKIIKEAVQKGGLLYLLDLFCNSTNAQVREKTAELFAKMMSDKLLGPRVRIVLSKFMPSIFMDAMRDSPQAAVHMFEGVHENPELIWNESVRKKVMGTVKTMKKEHYKAQMENSELLWKFPEDMDVVYSEVQGEFMIGNVYLRIFIANPGWVLRKPKEFTSDLLNKFIELANSKQANSEVLETVTQALICLFQAQPSVCDQVPALGHIPLIFQCMTSRKEDIPKSAILIVHQLANSEACIQSMAQIECIGPLKISMKLRRDMIGYACETVNKLFQKEQEELVQQALKVELVQYLLGLLDGGLPEVENPAATKAQIVKALKAMAKSLLFGEQINAILERSSVWSQYKEQKHDLFITDTSVAGYLTGAPGVAGYLTQGSTSVPTTVPDMPAQSQ